MTPPESNADGVNPDPAHDNPYAASQVSSLPQEDRFLTRSDETLNPWLSIWIRPRATIRQIIDTNPARLVLPLAAIAGIAQVLDRASMRSLGDQLPVAAIFGLAVMFGPVVGIVSLYVGGALIRLTGKWLGGVGETVHVRTALAWGQVPTIWAMLLWVPNLAVFGSELFTTETPRLEADDGLLTAFIGFAVFEIIIGIWQIVVMLKCIGEAHQFSAWSALGAVMLAFVMIFLAVVIPVALVIGLSIALSG